MIIQFLKVLPVQLTIIRGCFRKSRMRACALIGNIVGGRTSGFSCAACEAERCEMCAQIHEEGEEFTEFAVDDGDAGDA